MSGCECKPDRAQLSRRVLVIRIFLIMLLLVSSAPAQDQFDPDEVFRQARELGFAGNHEDARQLCIKILERYPDYNDVRVFFGRLYSWDGRYDEARKELLPMLLKSGTNINARSAAIDVELWSDHADQALVYAEEGILSNPTEPAFPYKKALALEKLNKPEEAEESAQRAMDLNPTDKDISTLLDRLKSASRRYQLSVDYGFEHINSFDDPWHSSTVSLSRQSAFGTIAAHLNYANRFTTNARQYEIEMYPRIARGVYGYVDYGYSAGPLFPRNRAGAELYFNPGKGLEFSIGGRYLHFSSDVWIYTASMGKYVGNYFFDFRPFVTPGNAGTSVSGSVLVRRYFGDRQKYIGFTAGTGASPNDVLNTIDLQRLNSLTLRSSSNFPISQHVAWGWSVGWSTEKLPSTANRNRFSAGTGFSFRF
jgi:YaiO family outer membrane protein